MSFVDDLKRSLGFEETEPSNTRKEVSKAINSFREVIKPKKDSNVQQGRPQQQYRQPSQQQYNQAPNPVNNPVRPRPKQAPVFEDIVITPEQSFYEIVLIRPKTIDDINYMVDQVLGEKNPVIVDLSFLEKESTPNFKLAGDKIKQMRLKYGAQAVLISRTEDKHLIIVSPRKVKLINKG